MIHPQTMWFGGIFLTKAQLKMPVAMSPMPLCYFWEVMFPESVPNVLCVYQ